MLRELVIRPPKGTHVTDEGSRYRQLDQSSLRSRPIRHQRQVIEIRPLLATIVEEGPHRTVEPKALLLKQSRAVRTDSVTACAETDGRLACFLSDPVTQSDDFCALQRFGQGADIAVCSRNVFFMGRIDPGMELRPHITFILCDPLPEQRHSHLRRAACRGRVWHYV